jgi:hypothetical protein
VPRLTTSPEQTPSIDAASRSCLAARRASSRADRRGESSAAGDVLSPMLPRQAAREECLIIRHATSSSGSTSRTARSATRWSVEIVILRLHHTARPEDTVARRGARVPDPLSRADTVDRVAYIATDRHGRSADDRSPPPRRHLALTFRMARSPAHAPTDTSSVLLAAADDALLAQRRGERHQLGPRPLRPDTARRDLAFRGSRLTRVSSRRARHCEQSKPGMSRRLGSSVYTHVVIGLSASTTRRDRRSSENVVASVLSLKPSWAVERFHDRSATRDLGRILLGRRAGAESRT